MRGKPGTRSRRDYPSVLIGSRNAKLSAQWRAGLRGAYAVQEASDRDTLVRLLSRVAPDILLLDLDLPRLTGVAEVKTLQALSRKTWIVVLSRSPNEGEGLSALKASARGYCAQDIDPLLLRKVVDRVHDGEIWAERRLIPRLISDLASGFEEGNRRETPTPAPLDSHLAALTPREHEIAHLVRVGASNKDIAARLNIGEGTVKAHLTSTFRKLGLPNRLGLCLFMMKV